MNKSNLKIIAATTIALIAVLLALQFGSRDSSLNDGLLFPDLRDIQVQSVIHCLVAR